MPGLTLEWFASPNHHFVINRFMNRFVWFKWFPCAFSLHLALKLASWIIQSKYCGLWECLFSYSFLYSQTTNYTSMHLLIRRILSWIIVTLQLRVNLIFLYQFTILWSFIYTIIQNCIKTTTVQQIIDILFKCAWQNTTLTNKFCFVPQVMVKQEHAVWDGVEKYLFPVSRVRYIVIYCVYFRVVVVL